MTDDEPTVVAAGGWCAPSSVIYELALERAELERGQPDLTPPMPFPEFSVTRGGLTWDALQRTPAEQAAADALAAQLHRLRALWAEQRTATIDAAVLVALAEGYDVHVYDPPSREWAWTPDDSDRLLRRCAYVGIEFTPGDYALPVLHLHPDHDVAWTDDDEW